MIKTALVAALLFPTALPAADAVLSGTVVIRGRIEKAANPHLHASAYDSYDGPSSYGDDASEGEPAQQLVVYLEGLPPAKASDPAPVLSQKNRNFTASIVPVQPGEMVTIRNDDRVRHHVRSNAKPWDFNLKPRPPGESVTRSFEAPKDGGVGVIPVYCDIHSNMRAHILVMPSRKWQLLPETGGHFKLTGIPPGTYTLTAWHPTLKPVPVKVTIRKGQRKSVELVLLGKED